MMYERGGMRLQMATAVDESEDDGGSLGVKIEAQFDVAEYNIVILSAKDSTGLDTWLNQEGYKIPKGAEPYLRPYVENGSKFFVAKVDAKKVKFKDGQAMLSPLRFHYDTDEFQLPVRLGLMNSAGTQDLLVYLLARGQRYEMANYPNVTIPTNINVKDAVRKSFGEFYAALFDSTLEKNPKAVVTEYSWDAGSCDPCPEPALNAVELATLGADVLAGKGSYSPRNFVLTRLHARYSAKTLGEDLVFKAASPIVGGREFVGKDGLERGSRPAGTNNFQGRYAIRHEWEGKIDCASPRRGIWGGPPSGGHKGPQPATDLAFAPRGSMELTNVVAQDIPAIGIVAAKTPDSAAKTPAATEPVKAASESSSKEKNKSKGCSSSASTDGLPLALAFLGLLVWRRREDSELC
jgi:MYXO-CTERM domain-containing protein